MIFNDKFNVDFPDLNVKDEFPFSLYFQFDTFFEEEFILIFQKYLMKSGINRLLFTALDIQIPEMTVEIKSKNFFQDVEMKLRKRILSREISEAPASIYEITNKAILHPLNNEVHFVVLLDREFEICVFFIQRKHEFDLFQKLTEEWVCTQPILFLLEIGISHSTIEKLKINGLV